MRPRFCLILLFLFHCFSQALIAQDRYRFSDPLNDRLSLSFELSQNLIIIPSRINRSTPLQLVLDSGISNTIITGLSDTDTVTIPQARKIHVGGLGTGVPLDAYYSAENRIDIEHPDDSTNRICAENMEIYVLAEDQFELSRQLGVKVNGLIGSGLFENFVIAIDPVMKTITFHNRQSFNFRRYSRTYSTVPLTIVNGKAFVDVRIYQEDETNTTVRLLLDTGASLSFWIAPTADSAISVPKKTVRTLLGQGLNGPISGVNGRIRKAEMGPFSFRKPLVSYPDSASVAGLTLNASRHGSLGNDILRRFSSIIDFKGGAMYLRPNKYFKAPFSYNRSGMDVEKLSPAIPVYTVFSVITGSPADLAGLKPGDVIEYINYTPAFSMNLDDINNILYGESGRLVLLKINRNGEKLKVQFRLEGKI